MQQLKILSFSIAMHYNQTKRWKVIFTGRIFLMLRGAATAAAEDQRCISIAASIQVFSIVAIRLFIDLLFYNSSIIFEQWFYLSMHTV